VGHFRLQIHVAFVAIAVIDPVVHGHGHGAGGPGVAFVEAGGAGLAGVAPFIFQVGVGGITGQGRQVQVVVRLAPILVVKGVGIRVVTGVVAMHRSRIGLHRAAADTQQGAPLIVPAGFPFGEDIEPVPLAVLDVDESIRGHAAARGIPPVIETVMLKFRAQTQDIPGIQIDFRLDRGAGVLALRGHGHSGDGVATAVPVELVLIEIHLVPGMLVVHPGFQLAPVVEPRIAQVELIALVAGHVHVLVGETLIGNILGAHFQIHHVVAVAGGDVDGLVARLVGGGAHRIPGNPMGTGGGVEGLVPRLKIAPRLIVVRFRRGTVEGDG